MNYQEIKFKESRKLLRMAWTLEVIFCTTGLCIAFVLSTSHLDVINIKTITSPDISIGLLGFGAVALVELCKIPAVNTFLLSKTLSTKIISATFLLIACCLTFESMSTGFEQNFTNRENDIRENRSIVIGLNEQINNISREIDEIENASTEEIHLASKKGLDTSLDPLNEQIKDLRKRELQLFSPKDSSQVKEYKRQIESIELSRSEALSNFNQSQNQLSKELLQLNQDEQKEISEALFTSKIIQRFHERREIIKEEKRSLLSNYAQRNKSSKKQIDEINNKLSALTEPSDYSLGELASISTTILKLQSDKQELINKSNKTLEKELRDAQNFKSIINQKKIFRNKFEGKLLDARKELSHASESYFIHRIASRVYQVPSLADLTEKQVGTISLIFVFTLATLVALAGPMLAYCSMSLKIERPKLRSTLKRSLRRMLVSLRKRLLQPKVVTEIKEIEKEVEKIVEVEIEKKVYEKVEVPTPYEVTKFISVPVPTEIKDLPFANQLSNINGKRALIGGVK